MAGIELLTVLIFNLAMLATSTLIIFALHYSDSELSKLGSNSIFYTSVKLENSKSWSNTLDINQARRKVVNSGGLSSQQENFSMVKN